VEATLLYCLCTLTSVQGTSQLVRDLRPEHIGSTQKPCVNSHMEFAHASPLSFKLFNFYSIATDMFSLRTFLASDTFFHVPIHSIQGTSYFPPIEKLPFCVFSEFMRYYKEHKQEMRRANAKEFKNQETHGKKSIHLLPSIVAASSASRPIQSETPGGEAQTPRSERGETRSSQRWILYL